MKFLIFLIAVAAAGAAGYIFEPSLRVTLTGKPADYKNVETKHEAEDAEEKETEERATPKDDAPTVFETPAVTETPTVTETPAAVETPAVTETPAVVETPAVPETPAVVETPAVTETPAVVETPPAPVTAPATEAVGNQPSAAGDPKLIAAMQAHVKSGELKSFSFEQVTEWKTMEKKEVVDGVTYDVGLASFNSTTPFGVKTRQVRALIKDGKVTKWLWANSGMQVD